MRDESQHDSWESTRCSASSFCRCVASERSEPESSAASANSAVRSRRHLRGRNAGPRTLRRESASDAFPRSCARLFPPGARTAMCPRASHGRGRPALRCHRGHHRACRRGCSGGRRGARGSCGASHDRNRWTWRGHRRSRCDTRGSRWCRRVGHQHRSGQCHAHLAHIICQVYADLLPLPGLKSLERREWDAHLDHVAIGSICQGHDRALKQGVAPDVPARWRGVVADSQAKVVGGASSGRMERTWRSSTIRSPAFWICCHHLRPPAPGT